MPLTPGTKLGPYEIHSPLGAGGMGEVYRALDTRLDRAVAVKVLASHLSSSPELRQRMEREARAISSLNHPHICHLYDIGSQNGSDYLVMEFLEGETLAERLRRRPLPINEALRIGAAIAEALAVAHRQGIIHRDLKPGNIMLTAAGAKLMDFGLAKPLAMPTAGSSAAPPSFTAAATMSSPSPISPLTTAGSIVGTIQYMSPEQIEGKEADARSDIFAFGAVLYEMVTGKRPFSGKSQISLASAILESDPQPISAINSITPPALEHVVTTCLQKSPDDRFQNARDIKVELQWIAGGKSPTASAPAGAAASFLSGRSARIISSAAILAALLIGAAAALLLSRPAQPARAIRTLINPPEKNSINLTGDGAGPPVLSPDGSTLAFSATGPDGKTDLWVRPMDSVDARMLETTENATFPFWSSDSRSLAFFADGKLKTIDISGGSSLPIVDAPLGRGGAWGPGGVILFSPSISSPISRVSAGGGTPVPITTINKEQHTSHRWPWFLPDGKHFLYIAIHHDVARSANNTVFYASIDGRENRALLHSQSNAFYAAGYLLFARADQLMAQPFNPNNGTLSGEARILARGVMNDSTTWHMDASASDNGLLVFGSGGNGDQQLVWLDRSSKQFTVIADKIPNLQLAVLSPRGDRVALNIDTGTNDIWVLDLDRAVRTRLTFGPVANTGPVWSPDGQWIAFESPRSEGGSLRFDLYRKRADGSGGEELLLTGDQEQIIPTCWSHDGKYILYSHRNAQGTANELWALPLQGERKPFVVAPRGAEPQLSPNGHWLAYQSSESGINEIYVIPFGGGQGKWQVSANGGIQPRWSRDGKELYFFDSANNILAIPVRDSGDALQLGHSEVLSDFRWPSPQLFYDISPDSKKILVPRVPQQVSQSITVVTNFTADLKKQ